MARLEGGAGRLIDELAAHRLVWLEEAGVGFFPCRPDGVYDAAYFERYADQADSDVGRALMRARVDLVRKHIGFAWRTHEILDVGIGSGAFIDAVLAEDGEAVGYDVNPAGIEWLSDRGRLRCLYSGERYPVVTFWDVLEHMEDPRPALAACSGIAFVALPIFNDAAHVLRSRHYRRDEHYWYFTREGFRRFAQDEGFDVVDIVATETALGREGIETFVLVRRAA